jgi:hypothetical protein
MKLKHMFLVAAAVLVCAAANTQAQTVTLAIAGSSALFQEMGQAAFSQAGWGCIANITSKSFTLTDTRGSGASGVSITDKAAGWVAWQGPTCSSPGASVIYYINTDSVVGNRCFFGNPSCTVTLAASPTIGSPFPGTTNTATLPASISTAVNNTHINVAATDIRPEDAMFATLRALTPCGNPVVASSQYLGLGYQITSTPNQGTAITGAGASATWTVGGFADNLGGSFNVANFAIAGNDPASGAAIANGTGNGWVVTAVGAAPIVVTVSPKNGAGLGSLAVTNVNRATLAGLLDGTYGAVQDLIPQGNVASGQVPINVVIREPLSGTFNTMEYAIPNSVENQTSQEVGLAALATHNGTTTFPPFNCATLGGTWATTANPLQETNAHTGYSSTRTRAIGTGNMLKIVFGGSDTLGYAFWSQANFASATAGNAKYLTVDGIDPIQETWTDGTIPVTANGLLGNVSFTHVKDGSYPIWSILRLVSSNANSSAVAALATAAQTFVTPAYPDFVIASGSNSQLLTVRSHFSPPGVTYPGNSGAPSNGDAGLPEAGGDVGGMVYSQQADNDYAIDNLNSTGNVGRRQ